MTTSARDKAKPQRSHVFISYSRKDSEFVRRLDQELESRGRETWVDWQDIRPAEDFLQAIFPAIEGADTFVFVLSPDSVTSQICGKELAHAVSHNKRMIPVMARDVDAKAVPEQLAKLNWVFFCRENDSFEEATDTLISALDTDLGWVHAHTRLLTRAIEWEAKAKSNSFALRGEDLRSAEQWLAQAGAEKERQPTALQTEYIIASRKASSRRQRITLGAVTFGGLVALSLAILAWTQRGKAVAQQELATKNAAEATRQKEAALGALSQSDFAQGTWLIADQRAAQALAYLARAVRSNGNPAAATRIGSLLLERAWPLAVESPHIDAVKTFFSPTGAHSVVVFADGSAEIRDNLTDKPVSPRIRLKADVDVACFSPDGARVVLAGGKGGEHYEPIPVSIQLWDTWNGRAIAEPVVLQSRAREETFVFSPDARFLAIMGVGEMLVWDAQTGRELRRIECDSGVHFSRDGERLLLRRDLAAQVVETRTGNPVGRPIKLEVARYDAGPGDLVLDAIALSPDSLYLATAGNTAEYGGSVRVWDVATGESVVPPMEHESPIGRIEFSPSGQWLLALSRSEARVWDARTGEPVTGWLKNPGAERLVAARFSPDGLRVVTVAEGESVCLWELATGAKTPQSVEVRGVTTVQFSGDGQRLIAGGSNGVSCQVWDLPSASARPRSLPGKAPIQHGFMLATFEPDFVHVWDIRTAKTLLEARLERPAGVGEGRFPYGQFSADGRRLLVEIADTAWLWDLPSGKELPKPAEAQYRELSRDGSKILSKDKSVKIVEAESGRSMQEIEPAEGEEINLAKFSPDGRLVAIATSRGQEAGSAQLWDTATGQAASARLAHHGMAGPSFSPDGTRLFTISPSENGVSLLLSKVPGTAAVGEPAEIRLDSALGEPPIFSPDGQHFILLVNYGMRLFETASGKLIASPPMRRAHFVTPRFSADGKLFGTGGNGVQVWSATTGLALIDPVTAPETMEYRHVEFSADSRRLLAAGVSGRDQTRGETGIVDTATGRPIADWRTDEFPRSSAHFSPDDLLLVEETNPVRVWDIVPPGGGPAWLADLAEAVSGCVLTAAGALEVIPDRAKRLSVIRRQVAELPADDRWAQIARWFLAAPRTRTISPYSSVTVADYVEPRVKENSFDKLKEALAASPANPIAHALLGVKLVELDKRERHAFVRADGETLLATQLAPQNAFVWQARAKVLTALKRTAEAAAAAKMAAELSRQ